MYGDISAAHILFQSFILTHLTLLLLDFEIAEMILLVK
jgi:hypothetical protein